MRPLLAPIRFPRGVPLAFWLTGLFAARSVLALGQPKLVGFQPSAEAFPLEVGARLLYPAGSCPAILASRRVHTGCSRPADNSLRLPRASRNGNFIISRVSVLAGRQPQFLLRS